MINVDRVRHELAQTSVHTPNQQHWTVSNDMRRASCAEVDCDHYLHGWRIRIDALSPKDLHTMRMSGRRFAEVEVSATEHWWEFEPGQTCFRAPAHQVPVGRPELFLVGDRGSVRRFDRADQFASDCAEHTTKIVDKIMEG